MPRFPLNHRALSEYIAQQKLPDFTPFDEGKKSSGKVLVKEARLCLCALVYRHLLRSAPRLRLALGLPSFGFYVVFFG